MRNISFLNKKDIILRVTLFALLFLFLNRFYKTAFSIDFYQYWVAGQAMVEHDAAYVLSETGRSTIGFEYREKAESSGSIHYATAAEHRKYSFEASNTPFLFSVFHLFSTGHYDFDYGLYWFFSVSVYLIGLILLCKMLHYSDPITILMILFFTVFSTAYWSETRHANVNQIQIGLLLVFLWFRQSDDENKWKLKISGVLLGLLLFFKPNILYAVELLFASWLIKRDFFTFRHTLLGFMVGCFIGLITPMIMFHSFFIWGQWAECFNRIASPYIWHSFLKLYNPSFPTQWHWAVAITLSLFPLAFLFIQYFKLFRPGKIFFISPDNRLYNETVMLGLGLNIYLLTGTLVHVHYMLFIAPLCIFLLRPIEPYENKYMGFIKIRHVSVLICIWLARGDLNLFSYYAVVILSVTALWDLTFFRKGFPLS